MDVLVVGSSVIDLFLQIEDKQHYEVNQNKICLELGDKIPTNIKKLALGGNGANVSVGLSKLGIKTSFYTYLGDDIFSKEIEENILKNGVELIANKQTNSKSSLSLILSAANDRVIFSHHEKRDHDFAYQGNIPDYIFLTSIGKSWEKAYQSVFNYVNNHKIPLAFNPGSCQLEQKTDTVIEILQKTSIIFVNKEEAEKILSWVNVQTNDINETLFELQRLGTRIVSITDGKNGAYALDEKNNYYHVEPFDKNLAVQEKTGAGDAYTSGFLAKYLLDKNIQEAMKWGSANANAVMQKTGAQEGLLDKEQMIKITENNPKIKVELFQEKLKVQS